MFSRLVLLVSTLVLLLSFPPSTALSGAAPAADPEGVWPLRPHEVVTGFDPPTSAWGAGHRGVDLLGHRGQPVHAALPGRVSFVGRVAGRGVVVVDHGDTRTTYEPVGEAPPVGSLASAGDRIGRLEPTGSHCWPRACLHWGWLRGEVYLDPLLLVGAGPVRLLPLGGLSPVAPAAPLVDPPDRRLGHGARSGARVGLLIRLAQPVSGDVRVQLGRRQ